MYGIFTYIWMIFRANVGKYSIHGAYGFVCDVDEQNNYTHLPCVFLVAERVAMYVRAMILELC